MSRVKKSPTPEVASPEPPAPLPGMVTCTALRDFAFSLDGVNTRQAVKGEDSDIPSDLVTGLVAEGYVKVKK